MNIEKTECERLGYKYITIFECLLYFIHHTPFANEFISNNVLKELEDLHLKLFTGDIEIIEFGRKICKYDIEDRIQEKDKEIERLNNIINELEEWLNDEENPKVYYDWENKCDYVYIDNLLAKIQELKESGKNE